METPILKTQKVITNKPNYIAIFVSKDLQPIHGKTWDCLDIRDTYHFMYKQFQSFSGAQKCLDYYTANVMGVGVDTLKFENKLECTYLVISLNQRNIIYGINRKYFDMEVDDFLNLYESKTKNYQYV